MISNEIKQSNTKRIAKNTLLLYIRQILVLLVGLYTVRLTLSTLGTQDYGIYNVVAGVVVSFSFINTAMASGTQRFLNFFLGKENAQKLRDVYSSSVLLHILIALLFGIFSETIGLWFVIYKLNIPLHRCSAVLWVYQVTIISTVLNILCVPYNAIIIAYEKMAFFAQMSIIEVVLKLLVVFLLLVIPFDKLIIYSILICIITLFTFVTYLVYCKKYFDIARFEVPTEKKIIYDIISFSGWSLLGAAANVSCLYGVNAVLNIFTNVTVNAAMGIANQVNNAVYSFARNFQIAFNPQIIKSYSSGEIDYFINLICRTAKLSFFLLLFLTLPLCLNIDFVLMIWLKNVPDYTVVFIQLILINSLIEVLNGPLWMSIQATGDIRNYQIIVSLLIFINLPLSLVALYMGANPVLILYMRIGLAVVTTFWRVFFLQKRIHLSALYFIMQVIVRCIAVALISFGLAYFASYKLIGSVKFFVSSFVSCSAIGILLLYIGLTSVERKYVVTEVKAKLSILLHNV